MLRLSGLRGALSVPLNLGNLGVVADRAGAGLPFEQRVVAGVGLVRDVQSPADLGVEGGDLIWVVGDGEPGPVTIGEDVGERDGLRVVDHGDERVGRVDPPVPGAEDLLQTLVAVLRPVAAVGPALGDALGGVEGFDGLVNAVVADKSPVVALGDEDFSELVQPVLVLIAGGAVAVEPALVPVTDGVVDRGGEVDRDDDAASAGASTAGVLPPVPPGMDGRDEDIVETVGAVPCHGFEDIEPIVSGGVDVPGERVGVEVVRRGEPAKVGGDGLVPNQ